MGLKSFFTNVFSKKEKAIETDSQQTQPVEIEEVKVSDSIPEPIEEKKPKSKKEDPELAEVDHEELGIPPKRELAKVRNKLSNQEKQYLISLWATGHTPTECAERAREDLNIQIAPISIVQYSKAEKWQPLIRKIRQATMNDLAAVSGSHKKVRLERSEKVYEKAIKKGDLKHALAATETQRKEMEGGGDVNLTLNQFNMLSDEELEQKKREFMEKLSMTMKNKGE